MVFNFQNDIEKRSDEKLLKIYSDLDQYQDEYFDIASKELNRRQVDFPNLNLRNHTKKHLLRSMFISNPGIKNCMTAHFY